MAQTSLNHKRMSLVY
uniref:Uncharacterized protein n=1 Tax=Arundo donax TaxID=35708 RepID=A0A0A8Y6V9_ARUDO